MAQSRLMYADKKFRDAGMLAVEAARCFPNLQKESDDMVKLCNDQVQNAKAQSEVAASTIAPDFDARQEKIRLIMAEGQTLYDAGDFTGALRKWEEVYLLNPVDLNVTEKLGLVYRQLQRVARNRRHITGAAMNAVASWTWVEPLFRYKVTDDVPAAVVVEESDQSLTNALDNIIFPTFNFDGAELPVVIEYMNRRSKEYDPEKIGSVINYVLDPKVVERVSVTMDLNNVPMSTILQVLCLKTGLSTSVTDNGRRVMLSDGLADSGNEEREFKIPNALYSMVAGADPSEGVVSQSAPVADPMMADPMADPITGGIPGGDIPGGPGMDIVDPLGAGDAMMDFSAGSSSSPSVSSSVIPSAQWVACFRNMGIAFGPDTSVSHRPNRGTIRVRNSKKNLAAIEKLLPYLGGDKMIMVEVKAIEITDESGSVNGNRANVITSNTSSGSQWGIFQGSLSGRSGPTSPLRGLTTPIVNNWNVFASLFGSQNPLGSDIPLNISLTINAMSQSSRTETLSAPKIITANGETASLSMGKQYYFPTGWEEPEIETETAGEGDSSTSIITITPPVPEFDSPTFVGMQFTVKPQVLDSRTILVDFNCTSTAYATVDSKDENNPQDVYYWGYTIESQDGSTRGETYRIYRPRIFKRSLKLKANIYDGETLVLGGVVEANASSRTDKIPILGDLPFIGRLFQEQSETNTRKNMLIFMTVRLVGEDGLPIGADRANGLPERGEAHG